jgi:hypothetical protein
MGAMLKITLIFITVASYSCLYPSAQAGESAPAKKNAILDFEGDVIEGQRKVPELLLQQDLGSVSMDTVLFQRTDFNDFHAVDKNRRPRVMGPKKK